MGRKFVVLLSVVIVTAFAMATCSFAGDASSCKSAAVAAKTGTEKAVNTTGNVIYDSVKGVGNAAETVGKATVDTVEATGNALTGYNPDKATN